MPDNDPVQESYKNAGLFLGLLQSKLSFGQLAMEFVNDSACFFWSSRVRGEWRKVERFITLLQFRLAKISMEHWSSDVAASMKNSMLHSRENEVRREAQHVPV